MKKLILSLFLSIVLSLNAFAFTAYTYNASGSTEGTVGTSTAAMSAQAGRAVKIRSIWTTSDLSSSVIKIYIGAEAGVTDNYTLVAALDHGDKTDLYANNGFALFEAPINYQVKVGITSTTANTLIVDWDRD